jgi:hypothetical protein
MTDDLFVLLHVLCDIVKKLSDGSRPGEVPHICADEGLQ